MSEFLVIPALDLRQGRCVRLVQGRKDDQKIYDSDPVEVALKFQQAGASWLHVIDLDGAFSDSNSINRQVLSKLLAEIQIAVQFGGGLRRFDDVEQVLELGVSRVVLGTLAVESPETVRKALERFGPDRIAVGIDAREGRVMTRGWQQDGNQSATSLAWAVGSLGVERIVYTDIARDGLLLGLNIKDTCNIARESGLKVTASGGISSLEDIRKIKEAVTCGVDSVIVGKALYEGRFTLEDALAC
jgi:phosphoribosylformimino-5-aminoimidazole carboxamide ribotide isomerase